jgi:hypothetical protein
MQVVLLKGGCLELMLLRSLLTFNSGRKIFFITCKLYSTCTSNSLILFSQGFIYFTRISSENLFYFVKLYLFSNINITIRNQHLAATCHQQKEGM